MAAYIASMADSPRIRVRPTIRFLRDLGLSFPRLEQPLWRISHPLVAHMQKTPDEVRAGGAEPIRSLSDHLWWKCKTSDLRAIVTKLTPAELAALGVLESAAWWGGAAGLRRDDSASDFYRQLTMIPPNIQARILQLADGQRLPSSRQSPTADFGEAECRWAMLRCECARRSGARIIPLRQGIPAIRSKGADLDERCSCSRALGRGPRGSRPGRRAAPGTLRDGSPHAGNSRSLGGTAGERGGRRAAKSR
jgi:hypothetical protein